MEKFPICHSVKSTEFFSQSNNKYFMQNYSSERRNCINITMNIFDNRKCSKNLRLSEGKHII